MKQIFTVIMMTTILSLFSLSATDRHERQVYTHSAESTIMGQVVDTHDYFPVISAYITITDGSSNIRYGINTNDNGLFEFPDVPYGDYIVRIKTFGYRDKVMKLHVSENQTDIGLLEIDKR